MGVAGTLFPDRCFHIHAGLCSILVAKELRLRLLQNCCCSSTRPLRFQSLRVVGHQGPGFIPVFDELSLTHRSVELVGSEPGKMILNESQISFVWLILEKSEKATNALKSPRHVPPADRQQCKVWGEGGNCVSKGLEHGTTCGDGRQCEQEA